MKKIVIDVANLTISENSLKKTGIQEVIYQVLIEVAKSRSKYKDLEIILLPFLPENERNGKLLKLFINNPKPILQQIEFDLKDFTDNVWGFDLKNKYAYQMTNEQIIEIIDSADIFYLQSLYDFSEIFKTCSKKIKYASILYDITPYLLPEYAHESVVNWFNNNYLPSLKDFDKIISISRHGIYDLIDYSFHNTDQELHYLQLPNYDVDFNILSEISELEVLSNKKYFIVIGSIEPRKNILKLIKGFQLFLNKHENYYLVFIGGSGWKNNDIFNFITADRLLESRIIFTGYLDDYKMYKTIQKSIGLLMISNYEGFGLPLSLAKSFDIKTLSNWGSSLPEASKYSSFCVNSWDEYQIADGIQNLIENESKNNKCEPFTWNKYCELLISLLSS